MAKFNVGDKVVCMDAKHQYGDLLYGEIYTIESVSENYVELVEVEYEWNPERFHLVERPLDIPVKPTYNEYSLTELLQRIKLSQQIVENHIEDHHLGHLVAKDVMLAQGHLENAHNKIVALQKKD